MDETPVALVTGAGSGIGRATAIRLARAGARVLGTGTTLSKLEETRRLASEVGEMSILVQDVAGERAPAEAIQAVLDSYGQLDWLVNNAGIGGAKRADLTSDDDWDRFMNVNLRSLFRFSREALPHLRPGRGTIVNNSSILGIFGYPGTAAYSAGKAAIIGLTRQMAADYGPKGIRVNAVAPGFIVTELMKDRIEKFDTRFEMLSVDPIPMPRFGAPEDVANAIHFLCSDEASYINGHVLTIDGGWSVTNYSRRGDAG